MERPLFRLLTLGGGNLLTCGASSWGRIASRPGFLCWGRVSGVWYWSSASGATGISGLVNVGIGATVR